MNSTAPSPFDTIESSLEFVLLLEKSIEETLVDVTADLAGAGGTQDERKAQALQLVSYKINQLSVHIGKSRRLLNDLRMLRRVILRERAIAQMAGK